MNRTIKKSPARIRRAAQVSASASLAWRIDARSGLKGEPGSGKGLATGFELPRNPLRVMIASCDIGHRPLRSVQSEDEREQAQCHHRAQLSILRRPGRAPTFGTGKPV